MAFSRKKPAPTRRGRVRTETKTTEEEVVVEAVPTEPEAEPVAERTVVRRTTVSSGGGGLEMALVVVTLVTLIAAFVLLQLEMRRAFGAGWPI